MIKLKKMRSHGHLMKHYNQDCHFNPSKMLGFKSELMPSTDGL